MADRTNRGGTRRRAPEVSSARVDAPVGKAQWMDDSNNGASTETNYNTVTRPSNTNTVSRPSNTSTVSRPANTNAASRPSNNNIDPNAVYVAPSASGGNNNIDPNAVYVAPSVSGGSSTRPSNTSTKPNNTGTKPNTRPVGASPIVLRPIVDNSTTKTYLYLKVVDGGKRAEDVAARMIGESWKDREIDAAGGYDRLYVIHERQPESEILKLAADLVALGAKIELEKRIEIVIPIV